MGESNKVVDRSLNLRLSNDFTALLDTHASVPVMVIGDDTHWLDRPSTVSVEYRRPIGADNCDFLIEKKNRLKNPAGDRIKYIRLDVYPLRRRRRRAVGQ